MLNDVKCSLCLLVSSVNWLGGSRLCDCWRIPPGSFLIVRNLVTHPLHSPEEKKSHCNNFAMLRFYVIGLGHPTDKSIFALLSVRKWHVHLYVIMNSPPPVKIMLKICRRGGGKSRQEGRLEWFVPD